MTAFLVLLPLALLVALMQLATWRRRGRLAAVVRQIAVTDAIHAELGAVVAPIVRRRRWDRWPLTIAVPFDDPDMVKRVVETASRAINAERAKPGQFELVLSPQERPIRRPARAVAAARLRKGESVSWT